MNVFLLSFTSKTNIVKRTDIQDFFNTRAEVLNWYGIMPEAILVATNSSDFEITGLLIKRFGNDITFIITKTEPNQTNGFINNDVWEFINNPKSSNTSKGLLGLLGQAYNK